MKNSKGVSAWTVLIILILVALLLLIIGYFPFFVDNFNIKECLRNAVEVGNMNPRFKPEKVTETFFNCIDDAGLSVELDYPDVEFQTVEGEWTGWVNYYNDQLKIPIFNIKLKTIEKEYTEEVYSD